MARRRGQSNSSDLKEEDSASASQSSASEFCLGEDQQLNQNNNEDKTENKDDNLQSLLVEIAKHEPHSIATRIDTSHAKETKDADTDVDKQIQ